MKDFTSWGIKNRRYPEYNYNAIWYNLKTIRLGAGVAQELPPDCSEFYDISLGTKCNLQCPFCYTNALKEGKFYDNVCDKAIRFFGSMNENQKPFQVAIGSQGEPTIHPEFIQFLETLYNLGIVPNYTTNGITLTKDDDTLLAATKKYCGGVAVSANTWNGYINHCWRTAVNKLSTIDVNINIHFIIKDKKSVDTFKQIYDEFKDKVSYFVLLPLMKSGRATSQYEEEAFYYLLKQDFDWFKIAFGAHFYDLLKTQNKVRCWMYPPESFSKNLILDDTIQITPSSFNLTPLILIQY